MQGSRGILKALGKGPWMYNASTASRLLKDEVLCGWIRPGIHPWHTLQILLCAHRCYYECPPPCMHNGHDSFQIRHYLYAQEILRMRGSLTHLQAESPDPVESLLSWCRAAEPSLMCMRVVWMQAKILSAWCDVQQRSTTSDRQPSHCSFT